MKRIWLMTLALVCCLSLLLTGCQGGSASSTGTTGPDSTEPTGQFGKDPMTDPTDEPEGEALDMANTGKLRIGYTDGRSSVQYITSADALPEYEALAKYDEEFFREHALVLVTETLGSGSIQVDISAITVLGNTATVHLSRYQPGDVGTADMATWLLWAEVDRDLPYQWTVKNPAYPSNTETQ